MPASLDDLASQVTGQSTQSRPVDRGIKGTLIDDYAIAIVMKIATILSILVFGSILYLFLERMIGARTLAPIRVWTPLIGWMILAYFSKPFLRFGWWGLLATISIIPTTSGWLWQLFQGVVGAR